MGYPQGAGGCLSGHRRTAGGPAAGRRHDRVAVSRRERQSGSLVEEALRPIVLLSNGVSVAIARDLVTAGCA